MHNNRGGYSLYRDRKAISSISVRDYPVKIIIAFIIFTCVFAYCDYGMNAGNSSDDFSHWGYIVKTMVDLGDFGTNQLSNAWFAYYPPGISLLQYFFEEIQIAICGNEFCDWGLFFSLHILILSMFVSVINKGKSIAILTQLLILFVVPMCFFQAYTGLIVDPVIAIIAGCSFAKIIIEKEKGALYDVFICLACSTLVLTKDVGILYACFIVLAYALDKIVVQNNGHLKRRITLSVVIGIASIIIPKILWILKTDSSGIVRNFSSSVDVGTFFNVLLGNDVSYRANVLAKYRDRFFMSTPTIMSLWHKEGVTSNWGQFTFYTLCLVFIALSVYCVIKLNEREEQEYKRKSRKLTITIIWTVFVVYLVGLANAYITNFSESEASSLADYHRYLQLPYLMISIVIVSLVFRLIRGKELFKLYCLFVLVSIVIPNSYFIGYIDRQFNEESQARTQAYESLGRQLSENCDESDRILFITQEQKVYSYAATRYYSIPLELDLIDSSKWGSWFISESVLGENASDRLIDSFKEYDFVAICHFDTYLRNLFPYSFEIQDNSLYKVEKQSGVLTRVQ